MIIFIFSTLRSSANTIVGLIFFYTVLAHWWNSPGVMHLNNASSSTIDFTTEVEAGKNSFPKVLLLGYYPSIQEVLGLIPTNVINRF
jgi:hypothetical protein